MPHPPQSGPHAAGPQAAQAAGPHGSQAVGPQGSQTAGPQAGPQAGSQANPQPTPPPQAIPQPPMQCSGSHWVPGPSGQQSSRCTSPPQQPELAISKPQLSSTSNIRFTASVPHNQVVLVFQGKAEAHFTGRGPMLPALPAPESHWSYRPVGWKNRENRHDRQKGPRAPGFPRPPAQRVSEAVVRADRGTAKSRIVAGTLRVPSAEPGENAVFCS